MSTAEIATPPRVHTGTVCPLDCPDRCTLDVTVEDGKVARLAGNRTNPITAGFICSKVSRFTDLMYGPSRLLHPMRRSGPKGTGAWTAISWDEAIAEITDRLLEAKRRFGGESILPYYYGGSNGLLTQSSVDLRYFRFLGASN